MNNLLLNERSLIYHLRQYRSKRRLHYFAETESTNEVAKKLCGDGKGLGAFVVSDCQTAGKGRSGRTFCSPKGTGVYISIVYEISGNEPNFDLLSSLAGLAVRDTLFNFFDFDCKIKWPNDIYWKDRKICGMLIENDLSGQHLYCSVVGIGLNINQEIFRSDAPNPISLTQITGKTYDREDVLACFLRIFFNYYFLLLQEKEEEIRAAYMAALYHGDGYYFYIDENGSFEARIHAIEPTGHLILQLRDGERRRYAFKEVTTVVPR